MCKSLFIKINPVLRNSILTGVHAECMQAACTAVKMKLVKTSFDWSYQVVLIHLPISAYFFTSFILPPFTPCAISDSCFFLHQRLLYPQMGKFKSHLCHVKNLHVDLSKFEVTETQKRCRVFFEKEEVQEIWIRIKNKALLRPLKAKEQGCFSIQNSRHGHFDSLLWK